MIEIRTAHRFLAAASITAVGFIGLADVAAAGPVQGGGGTIVLAPESDPEPQPQPGPVVVANPDPEPQPDPPAPQDDLPIADPEPEPQPPVDPDLPIAQPTGHGDPEPEGDLPIANPEPDDEPPVDPDLPLGADLGCTFTHGCPEDEVPTPDGHCFDDAGQVVDVAECLPGDDEPKDGDEPGTEVEGSSEQRGALPRTGGGLAVLAGIGTALAAAGAAAKRVARG